MTTSPDNSLAPTAYWQASGRSSVNGTAPGRVKDAQRSDFGFASDFAAYAGQRLDTPASEHLLLGAVCLAAAVGPHLVSEMQWRTVRANIWILLIGPSGASKSTRLEMPSRLIYEAVADRSLPNTSTPESLIDLLRDLTTDEANQRAEANIPDYHGAGVIFKDEYSSLLRQITNPGYMAGAGEGLIGLYEGVPYRVSTRSRGVATISQPCLSLVGALTPHMFAAAVKPELIHGGYMARHIHQAVPKRKSKPSAMAHGAVLDSWPGLQAELVRLRQRADRGWAIKAHWPTDLLTEWDGYRLMLDDALEAEARPDELDSYYQRMPEQVMKLAMLLAFAQAAQAGTCGDRDYEVTESALVTAIQIVEASRVAVRETVATLAGSRSVHEAYRAAHWLRARGGQANSREVYKAMKWSADECAKYRKTAEGHGLIEVGPAGEPWVLVTE